MQELNFKDLQVAQQHYDMHNHLDILSLHKMERMKHYGLHYAKYVGRLARGNKEEKTLKATLVDTLLITLSAANALNQRLNISENSYLSDRSDILTFADAVGRFADACEKMDHLESFRELALAANSDILAWVVSCAGANGIDLLSGLEERREVLSHRQAYHPARI
ncbi:hypothetical protein FHS25_000533 [Rhizobium laguerreae]|uniref:Uncharacterized protein n=1 Tax=Rhizobium laguerreae TaxID=1076926 RepID=A0ABR6G1F4_9HYPH|nr:hypothetical protein [Rhizobium laguerreae]MBB3160101.1 hypothetical protein [Rhizobium laguerreae]OOO48188.1 hypothetical protein BS630_18345 [Rhizobium laguerreae]